MHEHVSLAILAGGRSRRMGEDKAFARFGDGTLIEWVVRRVSGLFPYTFIVAKDVERYRPLGLPVVADALPALSPTVGVYSAVLAAPTEHTVCLGCDIPFVTPELLLALAARTNGHAAVVPREGGWLQPMCAVYSRAALGPLQAMLDADERRIDLVYERMDTEYVDVTDLGLDGRDVFLNVNTPAELEAARARAASLVREGETGEADRPGLAAPAGGGLTDAGAPPLTLLDGLSPRVEEFMAKVVLPTVSFVGKKQSGKTTALEGVIRELKRRGRRVAAVKHDTHGFSIDVEGTDSHRLRSAGANVTVISSPQDLAVMSTVGEDLPLTGLVARIREPVDVVLTEGFMRQPAPKFEISRAARSEELIAPADEVLGIMTDHAVPGDRARAHALDDYAAVAAAIDELITQWRRTYLATTTMAQQRHAAAQRASAGEEQEEREAP
jgi:molybdopterin-guanine dinucleotide biosynthesis protein